MALTPTGGHIAVFEFNDLAEKADADLVGSPDEANVVTTASAGASSRLEPCSQ